MESTMSLYDFAEVDKNPLPSIGDSCDDFSALRGSLPDLNSGVEELSVDLQELIDRTSREDAALPSQLFPDLPDTPSLDHSNNDDFVNKSNAGPVYDQETYFVSNEEILSSLISTDDIGNEDLSAIPVVMPISLDEISGEYLVIQPSVLNPSAPESSDVVQYVVDPIPSDSAFYPTASTSAAASEKSLEESLKATPPSKGKSRKKPYDRGSVEYVEKRERNNAAVRKSRDKTKLRQAETNNKVQELTDENQRLQKTVDLLSKELSVIKGLFANVGVSFPPEFKNLFE